MPVKVLMVCLGNICRSPTAEGVLRAELAKRHLTDKVMVDSAGTAAWHIGKAPDKRSQAHALKRGVDIAGLKARQVSVQDFVSFDYILAMDKANLHSLKEIRPNASSSHVGLFLDFCSNTYSDEVPDPYYGEGDEFEVVLNLVEAAAVGFVDYLVAQQGWVIK